MPNTSLGRLFAGCEVSDWEEMFPKGICEKCSLGAECDRGNKSCAALTVIGALGTKVSRNSLTARIFAKDLKDVIKSVPNK